MKSFLEFGSLPEYNTYLQTVVAALEKGCTELEAEISSKKVCNMLLGVCHDARR